MLDGEGELVVGATEVDGRVNPGMEFARLAERLPCAHATGTLACVMRDEDGEREATLEVAQAREQRRDLGADILVDAMQAHEGVEDE
jgi:hypothetical protein